MAFPLRGMRKREEGITPRGDTHEFEKRGHGMPCPYEEVSCLRADVVSYFFGLKVLSEAEEIRIFASAGSTGSSQIAGLSWTRSSTRTWK